MAFEDYTLRQFEKAWFKRDYSEIPEEIFKEVHTEYIDTAGMYDQDEFDRVSYIQFLNGRINYIKMFIRLQREFLSDFGVPYNLSFEKIKDKYGYLLSWTGDKNIFENTLKFIESNERKFVGKIEVKIKELKDLRAAKLKSNPVLDDDKKLKKERESYMRTKNTLGKVGFKIDTDKTTVEEFALMIKQQKEDIKDYQS